MIHAVESAADSARFCACADGLPYFAPVLHSSLALFLHHPALMRFYLFEPNFPSPGDAQPIALPSAHAFDEYIPCASIMCKGERAVVCGRYDAEELGLFLQLNGIRSVTTDGSAPLGFTASHTLYNLQLDRLQLPPVPSGFSLQHDVSPADATALLFDGEGKDVQDNFYSELCTRRAHGGAVLYGAVREGKLQSVACAMALTPQTAYLAAIETRAALRGQGIGAWLTAALAGDMAVTGRSVTLSCHAQRLAFYNRLGFTQQNTVFQYTIEENL